MSIPKDTNSLLMVPIKMDALFAPKEGIPVVGASSDFSRLPNKRANGLLQNADDTNPYISETVLTNPFSDDNRLLKPGMHLHWALPDALTKASYKKRYKFPVCPNRWLVLKYEGEQSKKTLTKKWIVCSDYLWPEGQKPWDETNPPSKLKGILSPTVTFHHRSPNTPDQFAYRYQGWVKEFPLTDEEMALPKKDYLPIRYIKTDIHGDKKRFSSEDLTVIGNGDPHHAAFYPNCQNIFGMRDISVDEETDLTKIRYEVYGWYSDTQKDILNIFIEDYQDRKDWHYALKEELGWALEGDKLPHRILCHSAISFNTKKAPDYPVVLNELDTSKGKKTSISIGNSGSEALAVFLANKMSARFKNKRSNAIQVEDQLRSLQLHPQLSDKNTDLNAYFEEARHTNTFKSISGGRLWTFRFEGIKADEKEQVSQPTPDNLVAKLFLPTNLKERLAKINKLQEQFNRENTIIKELKQHIFTSWHRYMEATYHASFANKLGFHPIDELKQYIEQLLDLLTKKELATGTISFNKDTTKWVANAKKIIFNFIKSLDPKLKNEFVQWATPKKFENTTVTDISLAERMAKELNEVSTYLKAHNSLIDKFRQLKEKIDASKNSNEETTIQEIKKIVHQIETDIVNLKEGVVLPEQRIYFKIKTDNLKNTIDTLNPIITPIAKLPKMELLPIAGPRYWQPKEPVLLLAGPALVNSDRYGEDHVNETMETMETDTLLCTIIPGKLSTIIPNSLPTFFKQLIKQNPIKAKVQKLTDGAPWHPLFFEWEVRVDPLKKLTNQDPETLKYDKDFIKENYELLDTRSEFTRLKSYKTLEGVSYFKGRSTLVPYAPTLLLEQIEDYLLAATKEYVNTIVTKDATTVDTPVDTPEKVLLSYVIGDDLPPHIEQDKPIKEITEYKDAPKIVNTKTYRKKWLAYFDENVGKIQSFKRTKNNHLVPNKALKEQGIDENSLSNTLSFFQMLMETRQALLDKNLHIQTQALSGFNEALLGLKKTAQLEIEEPLGFTEYKAFTKRVAIEVGDNNLFTAVERQDFHPIRNGNLHLNRLLLVDSFGQTHSVLDLTRTAKKPIVHTPESMKYPGQSDDDNNTIILPPRITQPARVHFRWISADNQELESNAHPETSPICGWVMANKMDVSLMIYDGAGYPLGAIEDTGRWRPTPGRIAPQIPEGIQNSALRKMVLWLAKEAPKKIAGSQTTSFLEHFIDDLENIIQDIQPDAIHMEDARALLVGNPLALVQAAVDIHLKGSPAINQSMELFKDVIDGNAHYDDAFSAVDIPIRIGEQYRLNDGVVAYWLDQQEGYVGDKVRAPFNPKKHQLQKDIEDDHITFYQSIAAPAQRLSILMEPSGLLHCTTGILPTKSLSMPIQHYEAALKRMQVTFQMAPILSEPRSINLPLPLEAGYDWHWMERNNQQWTTLSNKPVIQKVAILAAFENGASVWNMLLDYGWIDLEPEHTELASLRQPKDRPKNKLPTDEQQMEQVLQMLGISIKSPIPQAHFQTPTKTKQGEEEQTVEDSPQKIGSATEIREGWLSLRPTKN